MSLPIVPITPPTAVAPIASLAAAAGSTPGGTAFSSYFADAVSKVESFQKNAQQTVDNFLNGEGTELHQVALATQEADMSFQLFLEVRNKVVAAYQEVMRMQI